MPLLKRETRLERIDWDFPRAGTAPGSVHGLHWFAGNYIPQIPSALIEVLSEPGQLVFDPFGGSGTTAIEALRLQRRVVVSDRITACIHIMKGKLAYLLGALDQPMVRKIVAHLTFEARCASEEFGINGEGSSDVLREWYAPDTLSQLRYLWKMLEGFEPGEKRVLSAVFSDVLFDCASPGHALTSTGKKRRHHWGWVADNVRPKSLANHNAIALFRERLAFFDVPTARTPDASALLMQQDARNLALNSETVDLVVSSPPYIGVIDYTHAHRLLYNWMGWPILRDRGDEIGARYRRQRASIVPEYMRDMCAVRDELHRVMRPNAYCALVLGESRKFPGTVDKIVDAFAERMALTWGPISRIPSRRRVSDRAASAPVEFIAVFCKR